jgi:restriction system protein
MARRKSGLLEEISSLPWPAGLVLGLIAFVFVRQIGGAFALLAWVFLAGCWAAAFVSFVRARKRKALLDTQSGIESVKDISWREFEMLVGEAFRRQGYYVEENGLGGKDGGIDLLIHKGGRTELVQCKQWRNRQVSAPKVREMWGLLAHHNADAVKIVCIGEFTRDAAAFAEGKAIELINGNRLLEMVRDVQARVVNGSSAQAVRVEPVLSVEAANAQVTCPTCDADMVLRKNRSTGAGFWGCNNYPRCKGTRPF